MLTFRELKELLDEAPEMDRVPSMRELMRTGTVFMERPVVNGVVTVFTNGLALFEEFDRHTVFPVHSCGAYVYGGSITVHIAKLNGRLCGAKRPHSVSEQPNFYQSLQSNPYNDSSHPSGGE